MSSYYFKESISRIDFIKEHIPEYRDIELINKCINQFDRFAPDEFEFNLVFVGPVGVGKTTLCTLLYYLLTSTYSGTDIEVYCYPEFLQVDSKESHEVLKRHLTGEMTSYEFQKYILGCWNKMMTKQPLHNPSGPKRRINIFERCCDDSVICFSNLWNMYHPDSLTDAQLFDLFLISQELNHEFNMPTYFTNNPAGIQFERLTSTAPSSMVTHVINTITQNLSIGNNELFIGLESDANTLVDRIHIRNRPGESAYTPENISDFLEHYQLLYDHIGRHHRLHRYLDLGTLVHRRNA